LYAARLANTTNGPPSAERLAAIAWFRYAQ